MYAQQSAEVAQKNTLRNALASRRVTGTAHVSPPTRPTVASQRAFMPPGQSSGWQQCAKVGEATVELVVAHQPTRDAIREQCSGLRPGADQVKLREVTPHATEGMQLSGRPSVVTTAEEDAAGGEFAK